MVLEVNCLVFKQRPFSGPQLYIHKENLSFFYTYRQIYNSKTSFVDADSYQYEWQLPVSLY